MRSTFSRRFSSCARSCAGLLNHARRPRADSDEPARPWRRAPPRGDRARHRARSRLGHLCHRTIGGWQPGPSICSPRHLALAAIQLGLLLRQFGMPFVEPEPRTADFLFHRRQPGVQLRFAMIDRGLLALQMGGQLRGLRAHLANRGQCRRLGARGLCSHAGRLPQLPMARRRCRFARAHVCRVDARRRRHARKGRGASSRRRAVFHVAT